MASRIFWIFLAGIALVGGIIIQDGGRIFSWADEHAGISTSTEAAIEERIERAIDDSFDTMAVVKADGQEIDAPPETKRAFADAVGRLVKAETDLAILKVRDGSKAELEAAQIRSDQARTDVETLKSQIERQKEIADGQADAIREQIRDDVRETVREAVRN